MNSADLYKRRAFMKLRGWESTKLKIMKEIKEIEEIEEIKENREN